MGLLKPGYDGLSMRGGSWEMLAEWKLSPKSAFVSLSWADRYPGKFPFGTALPMVSFHIVVYQCVPLLSCLLRVSGE